MKRIMGVFFAAVGWVGGMALSLGAFFGWAYWMWLAIQYSSFKMFAFGLLGPLAIPASFIGLWSLLFGVPQWLSG